MPPRAAIFERNVKFAKRAKKCEKTLDFFVKMITIVYSYHSRVKSAKIMKEIISIYGGIQL